MSTTRHPIHWTPAQVVGGLVLLAAPLLALGVLHSVPPPALDATPLMAWVASLVAAVVAVAAASTMLLALVEGLRSGSAAAYLNAAGMGVLGGTYAIEALRGPDSAAFLPSAASAIGTTLAAALLLSGAILGARGARVAGHRAQAISLLGIFIATDLALGLVTLSAGITLVHPAETGLWIISAALLALCAVLVGTHTRHALAPAMLAVGALVLGLARIGSTDVLVALAALSIGTIIFAVTHLRLLTDEPRIVVPNADEVQPVDAAAEPDERDAFERLTRELHGTIDELIQARRTIQLQRNELERVASIDELTGVAGRRSILDRLRFEAAEARRYDHPVALLLLDIDRLGEINREYGVTIGDAVLREVALRMRLRVREADAIGRPGSDGFLAILPHADERGAAVFADVLRKRIGHREILTDAGALTVTVSIGVALVRPGSDLSDEELLVNATEALASARSAGGDRIAFDRAHGLARLEERREPHRPGEAAAQDSGA